jgi:NADH-quinone oxidoreductase subunit A
MLFLPAECLIPAMLHEYLPVLIFLIVGGGFGAVMLTLGFLFGRRHPDPAKLSPYECGFEPFEDSRRMFDVRYYLVAIVFIIFDLETAFLYPWAVAFKTAGLFAWGSMAVFLLILVVGFCYEWKKGALEWD